MAKFHENVEKISLVGLGYVGLPLAVAFSKKVDVIGFDLNKEKINLYKNGIDPTNEIGNEGVKNCTVEFTCDETKLKESKFHIVAVPTPINDDNTPNLRPVEGASEILGRNLTKGSIVVYESTVYPGVTEEVCVPILEKNSGLKCGRDFKVGYSPERINPGDKVHRLENIMKIVSGMDEETLETVAKTYEMVIEAGVHRAESIKVAEAAKVIENSQRDLNIAFVNELSMIFDKMNIDTRAVLEAAGTKWNFLQFNPGLVGGHCIGVDPYYLTYRAKQLGVESKVIAAGRAVNDGMAKHIVDSIIKMMIRNGNVIKNSRVGVLGITFKENCPDIRNSKVIDIINGLKEYSINPFIIDPYAEKDEVLREYGVELSNYEDMKNMDVVICAVSHDEYRNLKISDIDAFFKAPCALDEVAVSKDEESMKKIFIDVKGIMDKEEMESKGYAYWRL